MSFDAAPTDLAGKTCLVTGANGGIGVATAEPLAACGARVLTTDLGDSFAGDCETTHRAFDLLSEDGLSACCDWIAAQAPDVLFNNAALFDMGSVLEADLPQYDRLFSVNVRAMYAVMQAAALALAPHKIRVNAISPGVIDTPMWKTVDSLFAQFEGKEIGQKKREMGEAVPLGYMGRPFEVARVAVFLAGAQSQYITAQTISVDGGNVLR